MVTHQDDPHVQEVACRAVSRLIDHDPSIVVRIGEEEDQLSLHNCVLAAMNIHLQDHFVFQAACSALHDMAMESNSLQQLIVAKGTYVTIVDHMRENKENPGIQVWLLNIFSLGFYDLKIIIGMHICHFHSGLIRP